MLKVRESDDFASVFDDAATSVRSRQPFVRNLAPGSTRAAMLAGLAQRLDGIPIVIQPGADQVDRALLQVAHALGPDVEAEVAQRLHDDPATAFPVLRTALDQRPLLVAGEENLGQIMGDTALNELCEPAVSALSDWVSEHAMVRLGVGIASAATLDLPKAPPITLENGAPINGGALWSRCAGDADTFRLANAALALSGETDDKSLGSLAPTALRRAIIEVLPDSAVRFLELLATHRTDMPSSVVSTLVGGVQATSMLSRLASVGLLHRTATGWRPAVRWSTRSADAFFSRTTSLHRELGHAFRRTFADPKDGRAALSVLHAFRHLVGAGEAEQAFELARYAAPLLIAHARDVSRRADTPDEYEHAARLYGAILQAVQQQRVRLPVELHGYARHYFHYNRAKAELEPIDETARGYALSVEEWRGHAMFWSRLARIRFYQRRRQEAFEVLKEAESAVDAHVNKYNTLIGRTVEGLLRQTPPMLDEAIEVWADFHPTSGRAKATGRRLERALKVGWLVRELDAKSGPAVVLQRPQVLFIERVQRMWRARLDSLTVHADGPTPATAKRALGDALRRRADELLSAYTHQLASRERLEKQVLFGIVDVLTSRLGALPVDTAWVIGFVERDADGQVWLTDRSNAGGRYVVPKSVLGEAPLSNRPCFAKVACDARGVPEGPVVVLDEPFDGDEQALFNWWLAKASGDAG